MVFMTRTVGGQNLTIRFLTNPTSILPILKSVKDLYNTQNLPPIQNIYSRIPIVVV